MIRVLIVDDEPLARRALRVRLEREPDLTIVGEAGDGPAALAALREWAPDLVFLDVQMPGMSGFEVLARFPRAEWPIVVFVTAHDAHALQAFEIHALDYLLKPPSEERFRESLRRARAELAAAAEPGGRDAFAERLAEVTAPRAPGEPPARPSRFAIRERDRVVFVRIEELLAVEAAANYVLLVVPGAKHLLRLTLAEFEQQLDPARFVRVHRSTIVQAARIREVRLASHGNGEILLEDGRLYRMSRAYRERVLAMASGPRG